MADSETFYSKATIRPWYPCWLVCTSCSSCFQHSAPSFLKRFEIFFQSDFNWDKKFFVKVLITIPIDMNYFQFYQPAKVWGIHEKNSKVDLKFPTYVLKCCKGLSLQFDNFIFFYKYFLSKTHNILSAGRILVLSLLRFYWLKIHPAKILTWKVPLPS